MDRETHTIISVSKKTHRAEIQFGNKWQRVTRKKHLNKDSPKTCIHFLRKQYKKTWKMFISSKKLLKSSNCGQSFRYTPSQASHTPFWLCVVSSYSLTALQYRKLPFHHGCHIIKLALGKMMKDTCVRFCVERGSRCRAERGIVTRRAAVWCASSARVCVLLCVGERERVSHRASVTSHQKEHPAPHIYTATK